MKVALGIRVVRANAFDAETLAIGNARERMTGMT